MDIEAETAAVSGMDNAEEKAADTETGAPRSDALKPRVTATNADAPPSDE